MSRDKELDQLEQELRGEPYLDSPRQLEVRDGMSCWLDEGRICNATCMAYNVADVDEAGRAIDGPDRCLILFTASRQVDAAIATAALSRKTRTEIEDRRRRAHQEPPDPFGRKKS